MQDIQVGNFLATLLQVQFLAGSLIIESFHCLLLHVRDPSDNLQKKIWIPKKKHINHIKPPIIVLTWKYG